MTAEHVRLGLPEPELGKVLIGDYIDAPERDPEDGRGESRAIGWKPVSPSELAGGGGAYLAATPKAPANSYTAGGDSLTVDFTNADILAAAGAGITRNAAGLALVAGTYVVSFTIDVSLWNAGVEFGAYCSSLPFNLFDMAVDPTVLGVIPGSFVVPLAADDILSMFFLAGGTGTHAVQPTVTVLRVS